MLKTRLLLTALFLMLASSALAVPMTRQQVESAVQTWLEFRLTDNRPNAQITRMEPHVVDGKTVAYIAHLAGGGFCICGADDVLIPVYFYVPAEEYDSENPGLQALLGDLSDRLDFVEKELASGGTALVEFQKDLDDRRQEWLELSRGQPFSREVDDKTRDLPVQMLLPLNSSWFQGDPYYNDCPSLPGTDPSRVGCVATAMAQIMYYWQWPETGYSTHNTTFDFRYSDTWISTPLETDPGITGSFWDDRMHWTTMDGGYLQMHGYWDSSIANRAISDFSGDGVDAAITALFSQLTPGFYNQFANFAATSYNFDLMQDAHTGSGGAGDLAVAQLCFHAGVSVDMNWGYFDSGAFTSATGAAYEQYFRYDPDHVWGGLDTDLIIEETLWLRPIQVRGANATGGGHSWVVSGYDIFYPDTPIFWMNMGWGSSTIGWFRFDNVPLDFTIGNEHTTSIAPASIVRFVGPSGSAGADGSPADPYGNMSDAVNDIPDNGTLIFRAGTNLMWAGGGVIDRPVTLKGEEVIISTQ